MSKNRSKIDEQSIVFEPPIPKCRKSIRSKTTMRDNSHKAVKKNQKHDRKQQNDDESSDLSKNESSQSEDDHDGYYFTPKSLDITSNNELDTSIKRGINYKLVIMILIIAMIPGYLLLNKSREKPAIQYTEDDLQLKLDKQIENIKTQFYNQEPGIWNDIASSIKEVVVSSPRAPSIILLFADESNSFVMDCLALKIGRASSTILNTDGYLLYNSEDFGDDFDEIIDGLNKLVPTKKAVIIRDILNINVNTIKALHNLCDRFNPLIREAIYILTMLTTNYESSQKKMAFVEKQIYHKFSKSMNKDILMPLITRITDGVIISVQPELNLRYCEEETV